MGRPSGRRLPFPPVTRLVPLAAAVLACALLAAGPAAASQQDVTILGADGTQLAATLFVPDGTPPPGGWPGIVFLHGLGGTRSSAIAVARAMGVIGDEYAVLAYDARGHGQSGGLIGIDGPNEISDASAVFSWLRDRPDVADDRIGGWGISYGGGALWNSLAAGVPWAALEPVITWTDLGQALAPQGLVKTGIVAGFISSLDPRTVDPAVLAIRDAVFAGRTRGVPAFTGARSSARKLNGLRTPVFMMQGRRDFAFGLDQVRGTWGALAGPKRLWIGNMGHAPSSFPAADTPAMLAEGKQWFDRYLRGIRNGIDGPKRVVIAASGSSSVTRSAALPSTITAAGFTNRRLAGRPISGRTGKVVWRPGREKSAVEVFGSPTVKVELEAVGGWSRLVAVLSARTPAGQEIVVAAGGVPVRAGRHKVTIHLSDQATFIPQGSMLRVTLASSSVAQSPSNLLYLDLPLPAGSRATVYSTELTVPVLATTLSR